MNHSLLLSESGNVYSMGSNQYGQLGTGEQFYELDGANRRKPLCRGLPMLIEGLLNYRIRDIATGNNHCLALSQENSMVYSWGAGRFGALGNGASKNMDVPQTITILGSAFIHQISAGANHSALVAKDTHRLYVFGQGCHG